MVQWEMSWACLAGKPRLQPGLQCVGQAEGRQLHMPSSPVAEPAGLREEREGSRGSRAALALLWHPQGPASARLCGASGAPAVLQW